MQEPRAMAQPPHRGRAPCAQPAPVMEQREFRALGVLLMIIHLEPRKRIYHSLAFNEWRNYLLKTGV